MPRTGSLFMATRYEFLTDGRPVQLPQPWEPVAVTDGTSVVLPEAGTSADTGTMDRPLPYGGGAITICL
ncbi:hypothetical protein GCM10023079_17560 [Streptomyces chitinivorans]